MKLIVWLSLCSACGSNQLIDGSGQGAIVADRLGTVTAPSVVSAPQIETGSSDAATLAAAEWHSLLQSKAYSGAIALKWQSGVDLQWTMGAWRRPDGRIEPLLAEWSSRFAEAGIQQAVRLSADVWTRARARAARDGKVLSDLSGLYHVELSDPQRAEAFIAWLYTHPEMVEWAHPIARRRVTNTGGEDSTSILVPDISPGQDYLLATPGALNIVAAWQTGLSGKNQTVVDVDSGWYFDHEDLGLDPKTTPLNPNFVYEGAGGSLLDYDLAHGTAVVGIVAAMDNGVGVTGIAPNVLIRTGALDYAHFVNEYADGNDVGGQIVLVVVGGVACAPGNTQEGCLPIEAEPFSFSFIKAMNELGVVVVEAAANGSVNLDEFPPFPLGQCSVKCGINYCLVPCASLPQYQNSGEIMVGASLGANLKKHPMSNCGSRVDAFAWGDKVVTTGYGDHPISTPGNPLASYTAKFDGTSAATPQVGGVIALWQEYVDQLYADQLPAEHHVYLNAAQVKKLLALTGVAQSDLDTTCPIGKQPDAGAGMVVLKDSVTVPWEAADQPNVVKPTIEWSAGATSVASCGYLKTKEVPGSLACAQACLAALDEAPDAKPTKACADMMKTPAKPMDLDGDDRGDLVAWTREHRWYIDLSTMNPTESPDGYGAWDLSGQPTGVSLQTNGPNRLFPVVRDYNSDGRADLALYNSDTGVLHVSLAPAAGWTDANVEGWDWTIDYSADPAWVAGSRPVPGDYDGTLAIHGEGEGPYWIGPRTDFALVTPEGHWSIDLESTEGDPAGSFEFDLAVLTETQLQYAPGWAYLPLPTEGGFGAMGGGTKIGYAVPDGVTDGGCITSVGSIDWYQVKQLSTVDPTDLVFVDGAAKDASRQPIPGAFGNFLPFGFRDPNGHWEMWDLSGEAGQLTAPLPGGGYGDVRCRPVPADYDNDGLADRAVLCPNGEFRLAYSDDVFPTDPQGFRTIALGEMDQALPGAIYPGGTSYQPLLQLFKKYKFGCKGPTAATCTIADLPTPPIGPYFSECLATWNKPPLACLNF